MAAFRDERDVERTDDVMAEAVMRMMWLHPGNTGIVASAEAGDGPGSPDTASPAGILFLGLWPPGL